jgi:hypothetical protein
VRSLGAFVFFGVACCACQPPIPAFTIDAPPRVIDVRPPRSVAFVREDVPLAGLRRDIEGAIPAEVAGKAKGALLGLGDVEIAWRLARRPVSLRAQSSGLVLEAALVGELTLQAKGLVCRASDAGVSFSVATRPTLLADGDLALDHLVWKPTPRGTLVCGDVPIPIGPLLERAVEPLAAALAKAVGHLRIPLGPLVKAALDEAAKPRTMRLGGHVGDACLDLDPSALVLAPVGGAGEQVTLKLGLDVAPRVTLGPCPESDAGGAGRSASGKPIVEVRRLEDRFEVAVAVAVPHAELRARVAPLLIGRRFGKGDRMVTIEDVNLGDAGGHLVAQVRVSGALNGTLVLWGTPTALAETGGRVMLRVSDLHASLDTKSLAERIGLSIWNLEDGGLEAFLRSTLVLDVTEHLSEARAALSGRHALGAGQVGAMLTIAVTNIAPGEVISQPGLLVLNPILGGHAELEIKPFPAQYDKLP